MKKVHFKFYKCGLTYNLYASFRLASFDLALDHANRLRSQMPATYNEARVHEMPIPSTRYTPSVLSAENTYDDTREEELFSNENETQYEEKFAIVELEANDIDAFDEIFSMENDSRVSDVDTEQNEDVVGETASSSEPHGSSKNDDNEGMASTTTGPVNHTTHKFDDDENDVDETASLAEPHGLLEKNDNESLASTTTGYVNRTTYKFDDDDDDLEYTYTSESDFRPYTVNDGYSIKSNDMLSNNWPFKENVIQIKNIFQVYFMYFK